MPHSRGFATAAKPRSNIVFIFTDDPDLRHGSLDTQRAVQSHLVAKGTTFTNHYATVAVCCPSRVSLMRGQAAHNTNNTDIKAPGGGFPKFMASAENEYYLPHWLSEAGYNAECNLEPYINALNTVVMSENGERPKLYSGYDQTDVIRIKAPFLPDDIPNRTACSEPHRSPTPPARYLGLFNTSTVPRTPNFKPPDKYQMGKPSWLRGLPPLNSTQIDDIDLLYQRRLESLRGVDDIVDDVVEMLKDRGVIDNTYIIYSTDQGYHLGTHRHGAGKCLPYLEDMNIPLVVRGPGVPEGVISHTPSTVTDFAPTFLEIAGLRSEKIPPFLDGLSLLPAWKHPNTPKLAKKKEAINVEFWGSSYTEIPTWAGGDYAPYFRGLYLQNDYKTIRVVGEKSSWMYSRWCNNDTELYNTSDDPYELTNLANSTDPQIRRVKSRLNALLMVTNVIQPPSPRHGKRVETLDDALDSRYDAFYEAFPLVTIDECLNYQFAANESPFFPPSAEFGLGLKYRNSTDNFAFPESKPVEEIAPNNPLGGDWDQRHSTFKDLMRNARVLTDKEINNAP
ncbi:sulfatase family protein [Aspergillus novofumigatus IBT 16806]|uniref:Alkaline phosphatase-like protein n=1 Tax=Aspergillus novofumigatus (strain IBT 16806) TaxID=1392255 RepID=A0A2I1CC13_ASPN1|nr:alkaline phosphatase-like protein [Aspergillus novofumigatus IBT 16806]PKX95160.1 alkaline phosphatase-like protein [Aspergillus novofumigatus IBT 16806]